jgi:hypothetical protein
MGLSEDFEANKAHPVANKAHPVACAGTTATAVLDDGVVASCGVPCLIGDFTA